MANNNDFSILRGVPTISPAQMSDWEDICRAYAKRHNAEIIFINNTSFGIEYKDGTLRHIYVEELKELLERDKKDEIK